MRKLIVGAAAFGLALVSGAAMAQNVKGPAAPNFGATSGPTTGGATPNTGTAQPTNPTAGQRPLYNYAPGQGNNQAQPHQRRGTTGYRR
jgi:hypothetical protein